MARPRDDQLTLDVPATGRVHKGRAERAVDVDIAAARRAKRLEDHTGGLVASARVCARALDVAESTRQVYAVRQLSNELRDLYAALGLVAGGVKDDDGLAAILAALGAS